MSVSDGTAPGRVRDGVVVQRRWPARAMAGVLLAGCLLAAAVVAPAIVHGQDDEDHDAESEARPSDRAGIFSTIVVTRDHPAADVACMFCTVRVEGDVRGDVAVMFGTVDVEEGQTISGDVAMMFSTLRVEEGVHINGDLATLFTTTQIAPGASVRGDRAIVASGLGLAVLLGPILLLIGLVWLIVWGVRRALSY